MIINNSKVGTFVIKLKTWNLEFDLEEFTESPLP